MWIKNLFIIIQYKLLLWEYEKLLPFLYIGQSFYYNPVSTVNLTLIIFPKKDVTLKNADELLCMLNSWILISWVSLICPLGCKGTLMDFEKRQYFLWVWWKSIGFGSLKMHVGIVIMGNSVSSCLEQRFEIAFSKLFPSSRNLAWGSLKSQRSTRLNLPLRHESSYQGKLQQWGDF